MAFLTYLLPLAAIAYVFFVAAGWIPLLKCTPLPSGQEGAAHVLTFPETYEMTRKDRLLALGITVVYAAVAFLGLGDNRAPQSFCEFAERGRYADITLAEETEIGAIKYYCGLHTGSYYLQFSSDGENFEDVAVLEQNYADLFKWKTGEYSEGAARTARYIRIIADNTLSLGELALYGADGVLISAGKLEYADGASALFDEQTLVPERESYMNSTYFDEIYHARTALEHIEGVYPYEISHPPLGKLIIALGIRAFGMTPFGWRFMGTLFGALMLPFLYILLKNMFGGTAVPVCGTVIFAFDFMHFTQTRIATIDTYAVFFIILMYLFMWRFVSGGRLWNLALSGLFFGLGAASKWTCIYAGGGLAVIWLVYWFTRRREENFWSKLAGNALFCIMFFIVVPCAVYYVSYWPYGEAKGMSGLAMLFSEDYAEIVINNQKYMFNYHADLVATHPYSSRWYQWIVDGRPILYYLANFGDGTKSSIGAFLSPLLCLGGLLAVIGAGIRAFKKRDGRAAFILIGYLAQLLPWIFISRLTFEYHYFPSAVFLTLALCLMFDESRKAELPGWRGNLLAFTVVSVALFVMFYPVLSGLRVAEWYSTHLLKWLPSWPF